jgi:hypothetical protein
MFVIFSNIFLIVACLILKRAQADFCAVGYTRVKGTFDSVLNLKYCIHEVKFQWPLVNLVWPPEVPYDPYQEPLT